MPGEGNREGRLGACSSGYYDDDDLRVRRSGRHRIHRQDAASVGRRCCRSRATRRPSPTRCPYREARWVEPRLVGQVRVQRVDAPKALRHPVFKGLRNDKDAQAVVRET